MAVPIISEVSELMLLTKDVAMSTWTPSATTDSAISAWAITGSLPSGLSFNTSTGAISGTPTAAPVTSSVSITATNATGASAPLAFAVKVITSGLSDEGMVDINIDLQTGLAANPAMAVDAPQLYGKNDDVIGLAIGFVRTAGDGNGYLSALAPTKITIAIRDTYEDKPVLVYDTTPAAPLDAMAPRYRALFSLTSAEIIKKLKEHEADGASGGTDFEMLAKCEITFEFAATTVNSTTARKRTTVTFKIHLAKKVATA